MWTSCDSSQTMTQPYSFPSWVSRANRGLADIVEGDLAIEGTVARSY
jgi:hypothetical protein